MKEITKQQIITIHTLLRQKGLYDEKPRIISEATGMRTERCSKMYYSEAQQLINILNGKKQDNPMDKGQKMKKHIIAMAHEMGWIKKETVVSSQEPGVLIHKMDYSNVHAWIQKYGYLHKPLDKYTYKELPTLVTQFKEVYASKMNIK